MEAALTYIIAVVVAAAAFVLGGLCAYMVMRARLGAAETRAEQLEHTLRERAELAESFRSLSADALSQCSRDFLQLAQAATEQRLADTDSAFAHQREAVGDLLAPVKESLERVDAQTRALEASRREAYGELHATVQSLAQSQHDLEQQTGRLVHALRTPHVRGRWGEMQLRRVVELAGMSEHCDFAEQPALRTADGLRRPDLIVALPGDKRVVVDAKTPLTAYLNAIEANETDARAEQLAAHARIVRDHIAQLGAKGYASDLGGASPDFVVLFLPGEQFFSAALEADPELTAYGVAAGVLVATPTTLIALLQTIAHTWRQERIAENAEAVSELGRELHKRLQAMTGHISKVGRGLDRAVDAYNDAVGSFESRVLVSARRFDELGAIAGDGLESPGRLDVRTRRPSDDNAAAPVGSVRAVGH